MEPGAAPGRIGFQTRRCFSGMDRVGRETRSNREAPGSKPPRGSEDAKVFLPLQAHPMSHQAPTIAAMNLLPFARPGPRRGLSAPPPCGVGRARPDPAGLPLLLDRVDPAPAVLTIAISARALFDLEEGHRVFTRDGVEAYARYQAARETEVLAKGPAFAAGAKAPRPERALAPPAPGGRGPPLAQQRERRAPGASFDRLVRARHPPRGVRGRHGSLPLPWRVRRGALPLRRRRRGAQGPPDRPRGRHPAAERRRQPGAGGGPAVSPRPGAAHRVRRRCGALFR